MGWELVQDELTDRIKAEFGAGMIEKAGRISPRETVGLIFMDGGSIQNRHLFNCSWSDDTFRLTPEDTEFVHKTGNKGEAVCLWHSHPTSHRLDPSHADRLGHPFSVPLMGIVTLGTDLTPDTISFWQETY